MNLIMTGQTSYVIDKLFVDHHVCASQKRSLYQTRELIILENWFLLSEDSDIDSHLGLHNRQQLLERQNIRNLIEYLRIFIEQSTLHLRTIYDFYQRTRICGFYRNCIIFIL